MWVEVLLETVIDVVTFEEGHDGGPDASPLTATTSTSPKPTNNPQICVGSCSTGGLLSFGVTTPDSGGPTPLTADPVPANTRRTV